MENERGKHLVVFTVQDDRMLYGHLLSEISPSHRAISLCCADCFKTNIDDLVYELFWRHQILKEGIF